MEWKSTIYSKSKVKELANHIPSNKMSIEMTEASSKRMNSSNWNSKANATNHSVFIRPEIGQWKSKSEKWNNKFIDKQESREPRTSEIYDDLRKIVVTSLSKFDSVRSNDFNMVKHYVLLEMSFIIIKCIENVQASYELCSILI